MGVAVSDLLVKESISLADLRNKVIAIDAPLWLYQFLSSIRQRDGGLLRDSKGQVTSHLTGLFGRCTKLMGEGIKLIFCFDGEVPELKLAELKRRAGIKKIAEAKFDAAAKEEDLPAMKKYASQSTRLTGDLIGECKTLLDALGLPWMDAASEAEAQAAYLVKQGDAYAVGTNDADALLFKAPKIIRNLNVVGKRKRSRLEAFSPVEPELITLASTLNSLGIDHEQLIALCMLVGTDYNVGGIKGIGPKNAVKLVKEYKSNFDGLFSKVRWGDFFSYSWNEVFQLFRHIPVQEEYKIVFNPIDEKKLHALLVIGHEFSEERIAGGLQKLSGSVKEKAQKGLGDFV